MPRKKKVKNVSKHIDQGIKYAEEVLRGKIPACEYIQLACQRTLDDLERKDLDFKPEKAVRVINFVELLPHVKGKWGNRRERLLLEGWQKYKYLNIFGFYKDGYRRFREVYSEIPRKNGKSIDAAAIGLFMLTADEEYGSEVYCGATTEKQAYEVFRPAKLMVQRTPDLQSDLGVEAHAKSIHVPEDGSFFHPVIGDPGDGASPHLGIVDEYHEHSTDSVFQTFQTGMGAREHPLMYVVTTAGDNVDGPCYKKREECIEILQGHWKDEASDTIFVLIYTLDESDDWTTEAALKKANPNYDISVAGSFLRTQQLKAIRSTKDQGYFKTKHLNKWVNASETLINYEEWLKCADKSLRIEDFEGYECVIGIDLSSKIDFTSAIICFYEEDEDGEMHYWWFPFFWLPEERFWETEKYHSWEQYITLCDGDTIRRSQVVEFLVEQGLEYSASEYVIDPWRAIGYEQDLEEETGIEVVKFPQTVGYYTDPLDELEAAIKSGRFHHPDDPVLNWMCSNFQSKRDTNGNHKPRKENKEKKIDGMCAGTMAIGRCMGTDEYSEGGMEVI